MAKATFIKAARKPIYNNGKRVEYVSQKGKKEGQTLSKIDRTISRDEQDTILINKGESYYTWSFMYGGTFFSKTAPRPSQLTQSEFSSQYYAMQESIEDFTPEDAESFKEFVENLISEMETLRDECQDKLDNMPESLQCAPSGELLQERIDEMDNLISELEGIECEYEELEDDDSDLLSDIANEEGIDMDKEGWEEKITEEMKESMKDAKQTEWLEEKNEELGNLSFNL